jgi:hypothetical protein
MLCSRSLLRTVLELIGRNPGMLLAANILFSDESRFHLDSSDGHSRVYRRVGERYADACVIQRQSFGGGRVMAWGSITAQLCSRSLLRTVLELIGRNPGMLLAVRLDVWNRFRRCTSLMWLSWRRDVLTRSMSTPRLFGLLLFIILA